MVTAVSVDAFAAGFSCGVSKIKIPFVSTLVVAGVSSVALGGGLAVGCAAGRLIPGDLAEDICIVILFVLGITKLFDHSPHNEADQANKNKDTCVSPEEAVTLGAALSMDRVAGGLGACVDASWIPAAFLLSFLVGALAIGLGETLGRVISTRCSSNLCWVSGILLIALAFLKFL